MSLARDLPEIMDETTPTIASNRSVVPIKAMNGTERAVMATDMTNALMNEYTALDVYVMFKNASDVIDQAMTIVKDKATSQIAGKKDVPVLGATVSTKKSVQYEYEDSKLEELEAKIAELKKEADERRKLLRAIKEEQASTTTGEILKPAKLIKDGLSLVVTLPQ
jgi:predicted transcriptional regulator